MPAHTNEPRSSPHDELHAHHPINPNPLRPAQTRPVLWIMHGVATAAKYEVPALVPATRRLGKILQLTGSLAIPKLNQVRPRSCPKRSGCEAQPDKRRPDPAHECRGCREPLPVVPDVDACIYLGQCKSNSDGNSYTSPKLLRLRLSKLFHRILESGDASAFHCCEEEKHSCLEL